MIVNPLHESSLAFPVLESLHLMGIVCGVGAASLMNLRLMGVGTVSPAALWRETRLWTLGGLTAAIFSGMLLFSIDPPLYVENSAFRWKMGALLLALAFFYTLARRAAVSDREAFVTGLLSLILFLLVPLGGIYIGYTV
jgi:hypothetical protein